MKSVEELREYSVEHLRYEVWMMQETAQRLLQDRELHNDAVLKNAAVESCVVHARSLTAFIYSDTAQSDDVTSEQYVKDPTTWALARGTRPPTLDTLRVRTNKEIAHLTTKRLAAGDPAKRWPLEEIVQALHVLLEKFIAHAAPDRLDATVVQYIAGLRPPVEPATITMYNPGSTSVITATRPLIATTDTRTVGVDVRTIVPSPRTST